MESKELKEVIKQEIEDIECGKISKRIVSFHDFKSKYTFLKNSVVVKIELKDGKEATIDITDYFYGDEK